MSVYYVLDVVFFFFKQKTAYELRISDWSSDVCSSDLFEAGRMHAFLLDRNVRIVLARDRREVRAVVRQHGRLHHRLGLLAFGEEGQRSEERRVGEGCVSTC